MGALAMRNIGLLLALAVVIFLVHKHLQTVPSPSAHPVGGPFSLATDGGTYGDSGGYMPEDLIAGNPNF